MKHERMDNNYNQNSNNNNSTNPNPNPNINSGFILGVPPPPLNYEDLILQNAMNASEFPEQPILHFQEALMNVDPSAESFYPPFEPLPNNQFMDNRSSLQTPTIYSQQQLKFEAGTPSASPLSFNEDKVNLAETIQNCDQSRDGNYIAASPLLVLSIQPWTGPYNFRIGIPEPSLCGVKPKWCFSKELNRIYVAKNVAFPLNVLLDSYPIGALLNICPVYNKSSHRMTPVHRCPNCRLADPNKETCQHIVQVEGSSPYYYQQDERYMVSVPLGTPAPGDSYLNTFLKVSCNTSCTGGPNRRTFSILITLKLGEKEFGRQIIDVKCCEGPTRDMKRDEKNQVREALFESMKANAKTNTSMEKVREVATAVANTNCTKKRKVLIKLSSDQPQPRSQKNVELLDAEMLMVPKIYIKRVKKCVNMWYLKDQLKKVSREQYSKNQVFITSTSDSD